MSILVCSNGLPDKLVVIREVSLPVNLLKEDLNEEAIYRRTGYSGRQRSGYQP